MGRHRIETLAGDPDLRHAWGSVNREYVRQHHSAEAMVRRVELVYAALLGLEPAWRRFPRASGRDDLELATAPLSREYSGMRGSSMASAALRRPRLMVTRSLMKCLATSPGGLPPMLAGPPKG